MLWIWHVEMPLDWCLSSLNSFCPGEAYMHQWNGSSLYPRFNEVERRVYWFHLVRPHKYIGAECGASSFTWYFHQICNTDGRPSVCPSVDRIMFALYLQQYLLDPFDICTSYQATSEGVLRVKLFVKFEILANSWNLKLWLSSFDLGSDMTQ